MRRRGVDIERLKSIIRLLKSGNPLPVKYKDHPLLGDRRGSRDCHIGPDWLLIYRIQQSESKLFLIRTGTHSDLF